MALPKDPVMLLSFVNTQLLGQLFRIEGACGSI